ncbi:TonB-dependent siderophore receptor [Photobacterium sanguinicancri]|uniref:TonB-dependent siderophore receptor n=1 Tax=Photobacterium sanguinicancri TaxID=875932 RepID=UPI0026E119D2|nr:TonB-dependent siderophore receptor [Photobacterium sanguinicancri]MDO6499281.1 TonB-dependent siderophore receptor [Photobacterium sanguinicancri]
MPSNKNNNQNPNHSCEPFRQSIRLSTLSFSIAAALVCQPVVAEVTQTDTSHMEEVIVWGAKVSSSSEFLGDEDISVKQADHLSDLLRDIPGVDVGGTHSVNQRINIRGFNETDLDIRLDGASQYANMFHHIGNLTLNPDIIKAVDIQVGANSVISGGLGGAVHFETKNAKDLLRPGEKYGARVFGGYASNDAQQGSTTVYGQLTDSIDAMLYGYMIKRGNFKDGEGNETIGAEGKVKNILAKLGWEPTENQRLELTYDRYRDKGDYSPRPDMSGGANNALSKTTLIPTQYDRDTITLNHQYEHSERFGIKTSLYRNTIDLERDESAIPGRWPGNRRSVNNAINTNTGARVTATTDMALGSIRNSFTYGVDYNQQESKSQYGSADELKEKGTTSAIFVQDKIQISDAFSVTPGIRYDHFKRDAFTSNQSFSDITWALAADYTLNDNVTFFASTRSLFKAPQLLESFIKYQEVAYLAEDIKAQTGLNSQGGVKLNYDIGLHSFASNITIFKTDLKDHLQTSYNGPKRQYDIHNNGDAEIKGFEASFFYGYYAFSSKLSYAKSDNENTTNNTPILDGNKRSTDMGDSINLSLDYTVYDLDLYLGWRSQFVLEEDNVMAGTAPKAAYNVHNLFAQWAPHQVDGLVMTFGIDNVFDSQYASHASRTGSARSIDLTDNEPGRSVKVSAAYQF